MKLARKIALATGAELAAGHSRSGAPGKVSRC